MMSSQGSLLLSGHWVPATVLPFLVSSSEALQSRGSTARLLGQLRSLVPGHCPSFNQAQPHTPFYTRHVYHTFTFINTHIYLPLNSTFKNLSQKPAWKLESFMKSSAWLTVWKNTPLHLSLYVLISPFSLAVLAARLSLQSAQTRAPAWIALSRICQLLFIYLFTYLAVSPTTLKS